MTATFTTNDPIEAKRLAKANDMAACLWELVHNGWRDFKYTDYDYEKAWAKINELLEAHGIDVDDLNE